MRRARSGDTAGSALISAILLVSIAAAISFSVVVPAVARHGEVEQSIDRDEALELAQSGLEWGLATVRDAGGRIDADSEEALTIAGSGTIALTYTRGDGNGADDDGDGATDEADEARFTEVRSIGTVSNTRRGLSVLVLGPAGSGALEAAILLNTAAPVTAIRGNSFVISGHDHDADGAVVVGATPVPALGTGGPTADLIAQLPAVLHDQLLGLGGSPSIAQQSLHDMDSIVATATSGGYTELVSGTYAGQQLGLSSPAGVTPVTVCNGNLHLAGTSGGSGTLIVNGDLHVSGDFAWVGTIVVRGTLKLTGGGKSKRLLGAVVVGGSIEGSAFAANDVSSMTTTELAEVDAENQAVYQQTVTSETMVVWNESAESWDAVAPDSDAAALYAAMGASSPTYIEPPPQVTETVTVEEEVWVPKDDIMWLDDPTAPGGGYWVEDDETRFVEADSDEAALAGLSVGYETRDEHLIWVDVPSMDGGGYWADDADGDWATTGTVSTVALVVQGVDPILELSGNVEILFSREVVLSTASTMGTEMSVLAWYEVGVAD